MPEPVKQPDTTTAAPITQQVDTKALNDAIVQGLQAGLAPVIERISENSRSTASTPAVAALPPAAIVRPSPEQIAQATIDGNTTELARLLTQQRQADEQDTNRRLGQLQMQGGSAIGAMALQLAKSSIPDFARFEKEIRAEVDGWKANNPSAMETIDHYKMAADIIRARHFDELKNEAVEEAIRKSREPAEPLEHQGARGRGQAEEQHEPASLEEAFPGWNTEFRGKARAVGGRTDEEELRKMGFKGGLKEVLATRKNIAAIEDQFGDSLGLDQDWNAKEGRFMSVKNGRWAE